LHILFWVLYRSDFGFYWENNLRLEAICPLVSPGDPESIHPNVGLCHKVRLQMLPYISIPINYSLLVLGSDTLSWKRQLNKP
jgi:hypothetical protein